MTTEDELIRLLEGTTFDAPPVDSVWQPHETPARSRLRPRLVAMVAAVLVLVFAGGAIATTGILQDLFSGFGGADCQPDRCGPNYQVVARFEDLVGVLVRVAEGEGFQAPEAALSQIARAAKGSFRDAVSMLDQIAAATGGELTVQGVLQLLGAVDEVLK